MMMKFGTDSYTLLCVTLNRYFYCIFLTVISPGFVSFVLAKRLAGKSISK